MLCAFISNDDIDNLASYEDDITAYGFYKEVDEKGKPHYWYEEDGTYDYEYAPDYSLGNQIFADSFVSRAQSLVPVDTGFLMSSIDAYADDYGIECYAKADYAEYVEYGTYKMDAQPYFEPALNYAYRQAAPYWEMAKKEANEKRRAELVQNEENMYDYGGMEEASLVDSLKMILLEAILLIFMVMLEELFSPLKRSYSSPPIDMGYFIDTISGGSSK